MGTLKGEIIKVDTVGKDSGSEATLASCVAFGVQQEASANSTTKWQDGGGCELLGKVGMKEFHMMGPFASTKAVTVHCWRMVAAPSYRRKTLGLYLRLAIPDCRHVIGFHGALAFRPTGWGCAHTLA